MNSEKVLETVSAMFPACVRVTGGPMLSGPLTVRERESLGQADESRIDEFRSGRAYAKHALALLGISEADLPIGPMRAPSWPDGVVGSIAHVSSHDLNFFVAAVAREESILAIGIDIEREGSLHPGSWHQFMTRREFDLICEYPADKRCHEALFLWCAKEATTKMLQRPLDPTRIEIVRDGRDFGASIADNVEIPLSSTFVGRTACAEGLFFAAVFAPRELNEQATR